MSNKIVINTVVGSLIFNGVAVKVGRVFDATPEALEFFKAHKNFIGSQVVDADNKVVEEFKFIKPKAKAEEKE